MNKITLSNDSLTCEKLLSTIELLEMQKKQIINSAFINKNAVQISIIADIKTSNKKLITEIDFNDNDKFKAFMHAIQFYKLNEHTSIELSLIMSINNNKAYN